MRFLPGSTIEDRIDILNNLSSSFAQVNFDSGISYSIQALRLATQHGDQRRMGLTRYNLGNAYYFKMDFKKALVSYLSP
ncbi:MAG: hypothetical protein WCI71_04755 [Bacteroidota bacterium]